MLSTKSLSIAMAAVLGLSQTATAWINGIYVPETAANGTTITVTLVSGIYIQNNVDFGVAWGLADPSLIASCDSCVGDYLGYTELLGGEASVPVSGNFTLDVPIPSSITAGDYTLAASILNLEGASGEIGRNVLSGNITITN